jgi:hypothetical protein
MWRLGSNLRVEAADRVGAGHSCECQEYHRRLVRSVIHEELETGLH